MAEAVIVSLCSLRSAGISKLYSVLEQKQSRFLIGMKESRQWTPILIWTCTSQHQPFMQMAQNLFSMQPDNNAPRLFRVACSILQVHKDTKVCSSYNLQTRAHPVLSQRPTKICSMPNHGDHEVLYAWAIYCDRCHRSFCFGYILNHLKIHSTEAILLHNSDSTTRKYHERHLHSRTRFEKGLEELKHSRKQGSPVDGHLLLACIALEYSDFIPPNPKSLKFGWYDLTLEEMVGLFDVLRATVNLILNLNRLSDHRVRLTRPIPVRKLEIIRPD
jgi:hypothetical protein